MSGAATILAAATAAAAVGSTAYGVYTGEKNQASQKKTLAAQTQAQQTAEANALSTERKSEIATNAATRKTPNVAAILARAATVGNAGIASTMLTGPSGVTSSSLNLGKASLLGA